MAPHGWGDPAGRVDTHARQPCTRSPWRELGAWWCAWARACLLQTRRLLRETLGSAGAQAPCWEWPGTAWPSTDCCLRQPHLLTCWLCGPGSERGVSVQPLWFVSRPLLPVRPPLRHLASPPIARGDSSHMVTPLHAPLGTDGGIQRTAVVMPFCRRRTQAAPITHTHTL